MSKSTICGGIAGAALAACLSACVGFEHTETPASPTDPVLRSYVGEWASSALTSFPTPESCGNLRWTVASQTATSMSGQFQATCAGNLSLAGTASGTLADGYIKWEAAGTASGPLTCPFFLTGTATPDSTTTILVSYTGQTCVGPISGSEVLRR